MITSLAILGVAAVVVTLVVLNRKLHDRLIKAQDQHRVEMADTRKEAARIEREARQETARMARRNNELERALALAQGEQTGLRVAAQDAHRTASAKIAEADRETAELRQAMELLWNIHLQHTYPAIEGGTNQPVAAIVGPPRVNGAKRNPKTKALAANR
jgi:hypothetical protein